MNHVSMTQLLICVAITLSLSLSLSPLCRSVSEDSNTLVTISDEPLDQLKITNFVSDPSSGAISLFIGESKAPFTHTQSGLAQPGYNPDHVPFTHEPKRK